MRESKPRSKVKRFILVAGVATVVLISVAQFARASSGTAAPRWSRSIVTLRDALPPQVQQALSAVTPRNGSVAVAAYTVVKGTQTYTCGANGRWPTKSTPKATMTRIPFGDTIRHFAGPRWRAADGSTILGKVRVSLPQKGRVAWLLVDVKAHEGRRGALSHVTNVSRIFTAGGLPPKGRCQHGAKTSSGYSATYVFWAPPTPATARHGWTWHFPGRS